jgi:hypothetical protein
VSAEYQAPNLPYPPSFLAVPPCEKLQAKGKLHSLRLV